MSDGGVGLAGADTGPRGLQGPELRTETGA